MVLFITDNKNIEEDFDTVVMGSTEFNFIEAHPYIASSNFSKIYLDLSCPVNPKWAGVLNSKAIITPVSGGEITEKVIVLLAHLYQDDGSALRYYYIKDKAQLGKILVTLAEKYGWRSMDEFY